VQAARKGAAVASTDPAPPPVGAGAPSGETPLAAATAGANLLAEAALVLPHGHASMTRPGHVPGATPRAELLKATQKQVAAAAGPLGPKWKLASCSGAKRQSLATPAPAPAPVQALAAAREDLPAAASPRRRLVERVGVQMDRYS